MSAENLAPLTEKQVLSMADSSPQHLSILKVHYISLDNLD